MTDKQPKDQTGYIAITVAAWEGREVDPTTRNPDGAYVINVEVTGSVRAVGSDLWDLLYEFFEKNGTLINMRQPARPQGPLQ